MTGFLGPNGAGKTTTLRMLLGLVAPHLRQRASSNGAPTGTSPIRLRTVGAVLESSGFHPARTARNHLRTIATVGGIADRAVDEVLELVGLERRRRPRRVGGFSMGMRQRLELARALLGDPEVLILDEPANGLDPQGIAWLRGFLRWYASEGRAVLVSSHLLAEAAQTVDEVIILAGGAWPATARWHELLQGATTNVRVRTPDAARLVGLLEQAAAAEAPTTADGTARDPTRWWPSGHDARGRGPAHGPGTASWSYEMTSSGESLEELFFELTEGAGTAGSRRGPPATPNGERSHAP